MSSAAKHKTNVIIQGISQSAPTCLITEEAEIMVVVIKQRQERVDQRALGVVPLSSSCSCLLCPDRSKGRSQFHLFDANLIEPNSSDF